jgi:hypothetical protein
MSRANLNTFALSLRGVFAQPDEVRSDSIAFMDNYLAQPQIQEDFGLTLRYCTLLAQLAEFLQLKKSSFLKLHAPFSFSVHLNSGEYAVSCHLVELLTRVVSLSKQCCRPVMVALRIREDGPVVNGGALPLLVTSDLDMSSVALCEQYGDIRRCIGLLNYCVYKVLPQAMYAARLLEKHSDTVQSVYFYYNTLRTVGSWIAAAIRLQKLDLLVAADGPYDAVLHRAGIKSLRECAQIVDEIEHSQHQITKFMMILRDSSAYEVDLRRARNVCHQFPQTLLNSSIACCFFRRAQGMRNARSQPDESQFAAATLACCAEDADAFACTDEALPDRNVLKMGDSPVSVSVFVSVFI